MFMNMWQWYSSAWEWSATLYVSLSTKLQSLLLSNVVCYQITVQVKAKLYSNFVKSCNLSGGTMEEAQERRPTLALSRIRWTWTGDCHFLLKYVIAFFLNAQILSDWNSLIFELQDLSLLRTLTDVELVKGWEVDAAIVVVWRENYAWQNALMRVISCALVVRQI